MKKDDQYFQNQLAEYHELRAELRLYLDRREKITNFAIVLTLGVLASAIKLENPFLFPVSALLLSTLWYDHVRSMTAVFRTATYIQIVIESRNKGLQWETFGATHPIQTSSIGRLIANGLFPILFLVHTIAMYLFAQWHLAIRLGILGILLIIFFTLLMISYNSLSKGRSRELDRWNNIISTIDRK